MMQKLNTLYEPLCEADGAPWIHTGTNCVSPFAPLQSKTNIYLRCRVPVAIRQWSKVKALVEAGVGRLQVMEQLGISKASYYRCLGGCVVCGWCLWYRKRTL